MLFAFKDRISKVIRAAFSYKFKGNIGNNIYCGKIKEYLKARVCERLCIYYFNWEIERKIKSAIFDNISHIGHTHSFDDFEALVLD